MGLITTQHAGFGTPKPDPKQAADPKPVTGFDYAGQPMRSIDAHYNGRPEHMAPGTAATNQQTATEAPGDTHTSSATSTTITSDATTTPFRDAPDHVMESRTHRSGARKWPKWSLEKRAKLSQKLREKYARIRAAKET